MRTLILNSGSSSLKYSIFDGDRCEREGQLERLDDSRLAEELQEILSAVEGVEAVGHRVVHGGNHFHDAVCIDDAVKEAIRDCFSLAPLHNPRNLACIEAAMEAMPEIPHVAIFDTAFHQRLPNRAKCYAIDLDFAEKYGLRRFGFHGPSHQYVAGQAADILRTPLQDLRLITCHLGNGASVCAVELGYSVETSMGMTPLEGLVMGTRSGDIDPGILLHLQKSEGVSLEELDDLLNNKSGLVGLTGVSNDMRDIQEKAAGGDQRARLALGVYAHRVRKYIGAYAAVMGGVDAVVMTAGIGENSAPMRRRILQRFEHLGLILDEERNADASPKGGPVLISADHSRVKALVIETNESLMMARETVKIAKGHHLVKKIQPIKIAISARHAHLTPDTFAKLFGEEAEFTKHKDLSQPGQFASEQKINLIGPRDRIDGVRILGPLRERNQIEISRTDEFRLGVDAPVRPSGQTIGSAPILIEGPKGTLQLDEGLICAWRHIHMTPQDAEAYGVRNGDMVEVEVQGGPRDLTFGDVKIRVSPKFATEMHIDTDEANAAEISPGHDGLLVAIEGRKAVLKKRKPVADG